MAKSLLLRPIHRLQVRFVPQRKPFYNERMTIFEAIVLGIVEGLTEFLPVSSTGHLILTGHLLGLSGEVASTFEIFIQLGAILAVVFLYWKRFGQLFQFKRHDGFAGLKGWMLLLTTILPALTLGLLLHDIIKTRLFNPVTVTWALGIGGILLILVERLRLKSTTASLDSLTFSQALFVGLFQCLSLWPGVSRSGATIIGGMFSGLHRTLAAEYSFIVAVPLMCVVTLYDLAKSWHSLHSHDLVIFAVGFVVSFVSAMLAIQFFIRLLQHWTLTPFGVYRVAAALLYFYCFVR